MALSTQPYKGTRDFYPEDKRIQKYMFDKLRSVCELYGYEEYDAPVLEPTELFLAKGNEEIINEQTYTFKDRGDRSVTMRTEMTPTVSRMVAAKRQELPYPLRWYSIPNLWRYERPQKGRLREFWQLNVDIFGISGVEADLEIIQLSDAIMKGFGATSEMYSIKLNSRSLMDYITKEYLGLDEVQASTLVHLIDRKSKLEKAEFVSLLEGIFTPSQREMGLTEKIDSLLKAKRVEDLPEEILAQTSAIKLLSLVNLLQLQGMKNAVYDPSLMRGFDYYTDIVFEVFDNNPDNNRSMFGGGRYDGLVGHFGVEPVATFGFGMGDVTLQNFLEANKLLPDQKSCTDVYAIIIGENVAPRAAKVINVLREGGVKVAVDFSNRKVDKQIKTALKKSINYALFIGEQELNDGVYKLKDLGENTEASHSIERIISMIKDHRRK